jgi:hypothetical protein
MFLFIIFALWIAFRPLGGCRTFEGRVASGALVMAFGIWVLLGSTGVSFVHGVHGMYIEPRIFGVLLGAWLVAKGAYRLAY